ncbi:MAG: Ppx/GppA family phosphatase [Actinobacteria bacterium]|nr:MAG: Ppx/GppA family phosphatase [Actinomycetota bacterium]
MTGTRRLAAIDIGTVTTRLLVADVGPDMIDEVVRSTDITHLGEGLTATGRLSEAAMGRVASVIARYAKIISESDVEALTALATSASRDAENGAEFRAMLAAHGVEPTIIAGDREAQLAFAGATFGLQGEGLLAVDLGGGSTELVLGTVALEDGTRVRRIDSARSVDVGSKRVTEMFLHSDPPTPAELEMARAWVVDELRPYFDGLRTKPRVMLALAGTATTLAAIKLEMAEYDASVVHGSCLTGPDLSELLGMLAELTVEQRKHVIGLDPGRAPVIVAGALILECVVGLAGLDSAVVSDHDILYGILLDTYRDLRERDSGTGE